MSATVTDTFKQNFGPVHSHLRMETLERLHCWLTRLLIRFHPDKFLAENKIPVCVAASLGSFLFPSAASDCLFLNINRKSDGLSDFRFFKKLIITCSALDTDGRSTLALFLEHFSDINKSEYGWVERCDGCDCILGIRRPWNGIFP